MLAAHMDFDPVSVDQVRRFWRAENIAEKPGLKAVDLFRAVEAGQIKALWIMATNPVDSMPEADRVRAAIRACPFVVVSDMNAATDTAVEAHVRAAGGRLGREERHGDQFGAADLAAAAVLCRRRARRGRTGGSSRRWRGGWGSARPSPTRTRPKSSPSMRRSRRSRMAVAGISISRGWLGADYDALEPVQWPVRPAGTRRMFTAGEFFTPDTRARFVAVTPPPPLVPPPGMLVLNTGRVRDHWHTMTRTGKAARLSAHMAEPFAELHPDDAAEREHPAREPRAAREPARHGAGAGAGHRAAAAGRGVRAHALDRAVLGGGARRCAGDGADRSAIGPAGAQDGGGGGRAGAGPALWVTRSRRNGRSSTARTTGR